MQPPKRIYVFLSLLWILFLTTPSAAQETSFWEKLLRFAGVSATPSQQKGLRNQIFTGDVWIVDLFLKTRLRLTWKGGFYSPVFAPKDEAILAMRGERLTRISVYGTEPEELHSVENVIKIVGFSRDDPDTVLILIENEPSPLPVVGTLSIISGRFTEIPYNPQSSKDMRMLNHLLGWEREYDGTTIYVRNGGYSADIPHRLETNIFLKKGNEAAVNLTGCEGLLCSQPALSYDGRTLVYIKYRE